MSQQRVGAHPLNRKSAWYWLRWLLLIPILIATFYAVGIAFGPLGFLGRWRFPFAGFIAAAAIVILAYVLSPELKFAIATLALLAGAMMAWALLSPPTFTSPTTPNGLLDASYLPLSFTYIGGVIAWLLCLWHSARKNQRTA